MLPGLESFTVSRESLRQIALSIDRYQLMRARHGRQTANLKRRPRTAGVITTRPMERVEIDHFLVDVHLVCGKTGRHLGRPWLTVAVDHHTGLVVGYYLSFASPSTASVLAVLRHVILPKVWDGMTSPMHPWLAYGIPDCIVVDNGLDLLAHGFQDACISLGIELIYAPPRTPWYKGTIERFGRTSNTRLFHWLPGTTLGKQMKETGYDAKSEALLTFDEFETLLVQYITQIHNRTPRRAKEGTPDSRWLAGTLEWPVRLPESMESFDAAVALTVQAKLQQAGITYLGLQYQNDALGQLWNRLPGSTSLTFKVNPLDLKTIKVLMPVTQEILSVDCVSDVVWPRTLAYHMAVRQTARQSGRDLSNIRELALAEAELQLNIERAMADGKRSLKRMQAEIHRQSLKAESLEEPTHQAAASTAALEDFDSILTDAFNDDK